MANEGLPPLPETWDWTSELRVVLKVFGVLKIPFQYPKSLTEVSDESGVDPPYVLVVVRKGVQDEVQDPVVAL